MRGKCRYPSRRADRYEASREGNIRHTMVPLLLLSRSTWPPSCPPVGAPPFDLAAELSRKGIDQPAAKPGILASRIDPLAVIGDDQAKLSRSEERRAGQEW